MKLSQGPAFVTTWSVTDAPDIHLLFMVGLVAVAGIVGVGTVSLLLVLAPLAMLFVGRSRSRRVTAVPGHHAEEPDAGRPPPSSFNGGDHAA
ncbi:hypothetical protein [Paenarthrobacter aurescens]|nr:hypothetical protein [Paenarthrobacter aurescens]MDO6142051.1 hypothetical protein [Paenarthrobacter aurescens]MDO6145855.1 hypothetical protein [Paenarthrobacter aurescens]MDO6157100.1 hypothetical protein [Paenarthrobacter aurescens]MDO6161086.1 hypothetical protein [Paenarthrobacter aurescens]